VQVVVVGVLPLESMTERPLATTANEFLGRSGGLLMAAGAVLSIYGLLSASFLNVPRLTYALAERGDFPAFFAKVHPRFRTPYVSILVYGVLTWAFAVWGNFAWNASLSAVARLLVYISICLALLVFRRRSRQAPAFRLPGALAFSLAGTAFCLFLMFRMGRAELVVLTITALLAAATWLWIVVSRGGIDA
jgi:APA family basic amino acid/polyamine antiporter